MSPEFYADLAQPLVDAYTNMETELMLKVVEYLVRNNTLRQTFEVSGKAVDVLQWQARRLADLGGLNDENIKIIAKYSGKTPSEIKRMFGIAADKGLKRDESILSTAAKKGILRDAVPLGQSAVVKMLEVAQRSTLNTFNAVNNSLLRSAGDQYVKIVNNVATQIMGGTITVDQAVSRSVKAFAKEGLTGFTAANGAEWTPEAYSRMVLQSDLKNTVSAAQEERYREYGNNYIEISAYAGARPKCAEDQGYIYSLDDDTTPIEDLDGNIIEVRAWSSSSYGEPDGILGINCGHSRWAFVPGLSTQANRNEDINQKESDKKYKERQQQRYIERNIRNAKREASLLEKSGAPKNDIDEAKAKVSEWQGRAREFVKDTNGTRYYERERIYVK
jgi:hypothetical protein